MFGCNGPPLTDGLAPIDRRQCLSTEFGTVSRSACCHRSATTCGLGMIGRSSRTLAITETPESAIRHRSDMKSHVILKLFEYIGDVSVTNVKFSGSVVRAGMGNTDATSEIQNRAWVGKLSRGPSGRVKNSAPLGYLRLPPGSQTRRYRLVVTMVGITASTSPTTATPSMAIAVCCQPIQAMNRIELRAPRMIQK
jgi:hypothetical protein